jgi:phosphoglucomutase
LIFAYTWYAKNKSVLSIGIQFGTAGLRGRMAAGFSCMNSLTVIQTSQGLAKYIKNKHRNLSHLGVVIAYDSRHNSHKFATLAASAFVVMGIKVHWYENMSPTPLVSFGVERLRAVAGIMITGSHVSRA